MFLIENNFAPIGMVGIDWREPDAPELGYWLGVEHWGQGFGTEAARAVIDFTFEEFDVEHLISGARVANPSSRNILEKCGFQWSGVELHRFEALGSSTPVDCFRLVAQRLVVAEELGQFDAARAVAHCRSAKRGRKSVQLLQERRGMSARARRPGRRSHHTGGLTTVSSRPSFRSRRKI